MNYFKYFKHPVLLFHDGGPYHIETSPLIYSANQWTGFYMITVSIMKELMKKLCITETELRKSVDYKKSVYFFASILNIFQSLSL